VAVAVPEVLVLIQAKDLLVVVLTEAKDLLFPVS